MERPYEDTLTDFYQLIQGFDYAMMTTVGRDGNLHSRPMATQPPLNDSPLWFVSSIDSLKAKDLEADNRINLGYFRRSDGAYVSVAGRARLERNSARISTLWKDDWSIWFPNGPNDPDLALIHVVPEEATYWIPSGGTNRFMEKTMAYLAGDNRAPNLPKTIRLPH